MACPKCGAEQSIIRMFQSVKSIENSDQEYPTVNMLCRCLWCEAEYTETYTLEKVNYV